MAKKSRRADARRVAKKAQRTKDRAHKKQTPRDRIPAWCFDTIGPMQPEELDAFEDIVNADLAMITLGTWEVQHYDNIVFALKHFFCFAKYYSRSVEHEMMATMATAATQALINRAVEAKAGGPAWRKDQVDALLEPLKLGISTYFQMMRASPRSEHVDARREACRMNLTLGLQNTAKGGVMLIDPATEGDVSTLCGLTGVAFVHGRCAVGFLAEDDGKLYWMLPETESFIHLTKPTLAFFMEKEPSNGRKTEAHR